ncbi:MAG: hypothetical protein EOO15_15350 [Chitinophagaceae bacterium]|nr:MAG: hypothetical protein EOO15_15350 [Chitinophagaceae bacterium]
MRFAAEALAKHEANERIRRREQGGGRPIVTTDTGKHRMVAVRNKVYFLPLGGTFADFLFQYIIGVIGEEWANAELQKTYAERHTLMQWSEDVSHYRRSTGNGGGGVVSAEMNGVTAAYLGLAHALYRLDHNVALQDRLVHHLKTPDLFQGAYYECMVASVLIEADFELELEDETDGSEKHCEFSARSRASGKKYWVEAKMRGVRGVMGKGHAEGGKDGDDPTARLVRHVSRALKKPARDERIIFVDLNAALPPDIRPDNRPTYLDAALSKLRMYERSNMEPGTKAYIFMTSSSFHRDLHGPARMFTYMYGLGIPDFNNTGPLGLAERYRQEKPHRDALQIGKALSTFLRVPTTFDGSMASETFGGRVRPIIGEEYTFTQPPSQPFKGVLIAARVDEEEKKMILNVVTAAGERVVIRNDMNEDQMRDYRQHREDFFGGHTSQPARLRAVEDVFDWAMKANAATPRHTLIQAMQGHPRMPEISGMSDEDVRAEHAEWITRIWVTRMQSEKKTL